MEDISAKLGSEEKYKGIKKREYDDEEISNIVAALLSNNPAQSKIIVIDEIDAFEAHENAFRTLTKAILQKNTNTILIGIANSVDLPFKKKHSAISMRDSQLLFEPYSEEQIITIIEEKNNLRYQKFPMRIRENKAVKAIYFSIIEERAMAYVAKKISKMNGDVRVAFDLIKSAYTELFNLVKYHNNEERKEDEVRDE